MPKVVYIVKAGDTLHAIATSYGTTVDEIIANNSDITEANKGSIAIGQKITIVTQDNLVEAAPPPKKIRPQTKFGAFIQSCQMAHEEEKNKDCSSNGFLVTCDDLKYDSANGALSYHSLHLVVGSLKNQKTVDFELLETVGPCANHNTYVIQNENQFEKSNTDCSLQVHSEAPGGDSILDIPKFLKHSIQDNKSVKFSNCSEASQASLNIYADSKCEIACEFKFKYEWGEGVSFEEFKASVETFYDQASVRKADVVFTFGEYKGGYSPSSISAGQVPVLKEMQAFFTGFHDFNELWKSKWGDAISSAKNFKWHIELNPVITYDMGIANMPGEFKVEKEHSLSIGGDKLVKFDASYNLAGKLLSAVPVIGPFLKATDWILDYLEAGDIFLGVYLIGEFGMNGGIGYEKKAGSDATWAFPKTVKGTVKVGLKLDAKGELTISLGIAEAYGSGAIGVKADTGIEVEFSKVNAKSIGVKTDWLGVTVYYWAVSELGFSKRTGNGTNKTGVKTEAAGKAEDDADPKQMMPRSNLCNTVIQLE